MNIDNVRAWITGLGVHRQTFGHLAQRHPDGAIAHCADGVAHRAATDAGILELVDTEHGLEFRSTRGGAFTYLAVADWLGVDLLETARVHVDHLPAQLRDRVEHIISRERNRRPALTVQDDLENVDALGHPVWSLNDYGVPFDLLADVLRYALDVDRHLIDLTPASVPAGHGPVLRCPPARAVGSVTSPPEATDPIHHEVRAA